MAAKETVVVLLVLISWSISAIFVLPL